MDQQAHPKSGSYTANLLGNIRSHLAGLQGYDVMALELIQNADDAKAEEIVFDITDSGLLVRNSGKFTYCGDLNNPCGFLSKDSKYKCDYHRITDVGSGGKLSRSENIGRFGIGFVSTYQVTDHPEIRSSGIKLTLCPEQGQWFIEECKETDGTSFFLPWAKDPNTEARRALGISHISSSHIDQLAEDFQTVLRKSLLFLRYIRKAEIWRDGQLLLACDLDRSEDSDLIVRFRPSGAVEQWHILRADATKAARCLYATHPQLKTLHRSTNISIGLRIDPEPLTEGLLYAFLPTEQTTGLPLHLNADFFPESDRKTVIFAGHQHEQAWNEMLITAAAAELAKDPEGLLQMLGPVQLWQILGQAYDLSTRPTEHPACFKQFWECLKVTAAEAQIAKAQDGSFQQPSGVFIPRGANLNEHQAKALLEMGGRLVAEELRPFQTAMNQLGAPFLTLERLVELMKSAMAKQEAGATEVDQERLENFYRPLWSIINDLLPENTHAPAVQQLSALPFVVTEDLFAVTINQSYTAPAGLDAGRIAALLPKLAIASSLLADFPKITRLVKQLDLGAVVSHISEMCQSEPVEDVIAAASKEQLRELYSLFADLDHQSTVEKAVYQQLRDLPIWQSSRGLVKATQALLPGNFTDPTGQADLLDVSVLTESARDFLTSKLDVQTQTIEAFVRTVLPTFFDNDGPLDASKYEQLISELAKHPTLVDDDDIRQLLGTLPIVPTQDGAWSQPVNTYRRTEDLVKVLGDTPHLWLDDDRIPDARSMHMQTFINSLGIQRTPTARHLVDRMLSIAEENLPTEDSKPASSEAFYVLCDNYDKWKEEQDFQDALNDLRETACFPAEGDKEKWYSAKSLHAPYRADAFRSQANILDFKNTARLKTDLLEKLNISINPETRLVIDHLQHCIKSNKKPHVLTYQVLNERAQKSDSPIIKKTLAGSRCIYIESQKTFVRPNQLYWVPQQLGRYAYTIPDNFRSFKPLFDAIEVKDAPEGRDFVDILLDIVGEYFVQSKPLTGSDRAVYDVCLTSLATAHERGELTPSDRDLQRLKETPAILNLREQLTYPDGVLLQDSEWHAGFFGGDLDPALCKPVPELWPFMKEIGVKRLTESAQVILDFVDGSEADETAFAEKLRDRMDILARVLHDKPTTVRRKIRSALSEMKAVSHDVVRIQASVRVGGYPAVAPPTSVQAFYDIEKGRLILARPVGDQSWPHVLNALFHQLMPEESGSEISKLTLIVRPLMGMAVEEAHRYLTEAGIPYLDAETGNGHTEDLTSPDLDEMGGTAEPDDHEESGAASTSVDDSGEQTGGAPGTPHGKRQRDSSGSSTAGEATEQPERVTESDGSRPGVTGRDGSESGGSTPGAGEPRAYKPRPKHKKQWDRRLLSYVRQRQEDASDAGDQDETTKHNLAVEIVAREAVCAYEKERGRVPEEMDQTHPGSDIFSRNPVTGEERIIEVKGVNGEWNQTGVGLSQTQFSNAQNFGDCYWLYVVEFVSDPEHIRVHPIRNPANQVTDFMFDGNWRNAATEEKADPSAPFIPGARIQYQDDGCVVCGVIQEVITRSDSKLLMILFDGQSRATRVPWNLYRMKILEDPDDDNDS